MSDDSFLQIATYDARKKSVPLAYALWFFLSVFGAHRFYANQAPMTGAIQAGMFIIGLFAMMSGSGVGLVLIAADAIWALIDAFFIPGWVAEHNVRLAKSLSTTAS